MSTSPPPLPLYRHAVVDRYFLEHRATVLDLAAFLDRVDRAKPDAADSNRDFRLDSLRGAIALLLGGEPERAKRGLDLMSDPSTRPIAAAPMMGATGAWDGFKPASARDGENG